MTNKKVINRIILSFFFILSVIFIVLIMRLTKYNCFWGDDFVYAIYQKGENVFDCLFGDIRLEHGGYYLGQFLIKFISIKESYSFFPNSRTR